LAVKLLSLYDSWTYQGHELEDMVLPFQMRLRMEELDPKDWGDYEEEGDPAYWWIQRLLRSDNAGTFWLKPLIEEGRLLLRYDEANKAKYARTYAFETTLHLFSHQVIRPRAFKAIAVNLGHTNSKVFDSVYDPAKHELMVSFVRRSDKLWNVSLYSTKPEIDCGEIAKSFGGGGHKGAAGFQGKELPFEY
jgi:oligoribonuclease NrnB/cAMP/cGMP phosphodiesterase (DHH superfamily)